MSEAVSSLRPWPSREKTLSEAIVWGGWSGQLWRCLMVLDVLCYDGK